MSINFNVFSKMMSQLSNKEIPEVVFNPASSLGMTIDRLSSNIIFTEKTVDDVIKDLTKNINDPIHKHDVKALAQIINAYSNSIINSFNILNFIKESVDTLKIKIEEEVKKTAAHSPTITEANIFNSDKYDVQFSMVPWSDIDKLGTKPFVVEQLQGTLSVFADMTPVNVSFSSTSMTILFNSFVRYFKELEIKGIDISEENINKLSDFCHERLDITHDNVRRYLNIITNKERLTQWVNMALNKASGADVMVAADMVSIVEDIADVVTLDKLVELVDKNLSSACELTDEQINIFNEHIRLVINTLYFKFFYIQAQRERNKDILIFDQHLINPDALVQFRKAGCDVDDISKFIYQRLKNNQPFKGIPYDAVKASIDNVRDEINRNKESLNRLATLELNDIKKRSFIRNMTEFMDQLVQEPKISNIPKYIEHMASDINYLSGDLESAIYGVIINAEFPNTFVQDLYEKLGKGYISVLSSNKDVSATDISEVETNIILNIITEHLVEKLVDDIK